MSGAFEGVVDISDERFVFDITIPDTRGLPWEMVCYANCEAEWRHFVRLESDEAGDMRARVGKRLRGEESAASGTSIQVRFSSREIHLTLDEHGWVTDTLTNYIDSQTNSITLILLISPEFRETNQYLARRLTVPPSSLKKDLAWLLKSSRKADIIVDVWGGQKFAYHSTIVDCRRVQRFIRKRYDDWWPKYTVPFMPIIKSVPDHEEIKAFLHYIYTDELPETINPFIAQRLLFFGHEYKITRLKALCALYLAQNLAPDNISATFSYSIDFPTPQLTQVVHDYLLIPANRLGTIQYMVLNPELFQDSSQLVQYHDLTDQLITGLKQACLMIVEDDSSDNIDYIVAAKNVIKFLNDPSYCY